MGSGGSQEKKSHADHVFFHQYRRKSFISAAFILSPMSTSSHPWRAAQNEVFLNSNLFVVVVFLSLFHLDYLSLVTCLLFNSVRKSNYFVIAICLLT